MTVQDLIDKLQKIDNKEIEVKLLSIYSGETERVDLIGDLNGEVVLGSNDLIELNIVFVE